MSLLLLVFFFLFECCLVEMDVALAAALSHKSALVLWNSGNREVGNSMERMK